jgi:hypothetical protein
VGRQLDIIKLLSKSWEKCKTHTQNLLLQTNTKKASSSSASSASDQPKQAPGNTHLQQIVPPACTKI